MLDRIFRCVFNLEYIFSALPIVEKKMCYFRNIFTVKLIKTDYTRLCDGPTRTRRAAYILHIIYAYANVT